MRMVDVGSKDKTERVAVATGRVRMSTVALAKIRAEMRAPSQLHVVESGDHSLLCTKTQLKAWGKTQQAVDAEVLGVIRGFLAQQVGAGS